MPRTWPEDWEERKGGRGCPMCEEGRPERTAHGVRVFSGDRADAYLIRGDWQRGYTIVIWRGRHVAEPTELSESDAAAYWRDLVKVARGIESHFRPAKLNLSMLGNAVPHLHTHVVPRYLDDPAPGAPLPWPTQEPPPTPGDIFERDVTGLRALLAQER